MGGGRPGRGGSPKHIRPKRHRILDVSYSGSHVSSRTDDNWMAFSTSVWRKFANPQCPVSPHKLFQTRSSQHFYMKQSYNHIIWSRQPRLYSFVMDSPKEQQKNDRSKCYEKIIHDIMTRTEQSSYLSTNSTIPSRDDDPRSNKSTSPGERLSRRRMSTDKVPFKSDCRFP